MKNFNWANVDATTDNYAAPPAGGYILIVCDVEDVPNREYLKVYYDILGVADKANEQFIGYYDRKMEASQGKGKLPCMYRSYKQSALGFFKGFLVALEKSNPGFIADKFDGDESKLQGLVFGAVLGAEEYYNQQGQLRTSLKVKEVRSTKAIMEGDFKIPEVKTVDSASAPVSAAAPAGNDSDVPF